MLISSFTIGCLKHELTNETDEVIWENTGEELPILEGVWIETEYEVYLEGVTSVRVKWYNTLLIYYDSSFGYEDFNTIRYLMLWIVKFTFQDKKCVQIFS